MVDEQMSPEDQEELEQLAQLIAKSLVEGKSQPELTQQLVDNGWEQEDAGHFVNSIAQSLASASRNASRANEGGGGMGWLIWIGLLLFINLLSYLFEWPFWIY